MKTKTYFAFRVDIWDDIGNSIVEYVVGVDDFEMAEATYRAAVARWPKARITLRHGRPRPISSSTSIGPNSILPWKIAPASRIADGGVGS